MTTYDLNNYRNARQQQDVEQRRQIDRRLAKMEADELRLARIVLAVLDAPEQQRDHLIDHAWYEIGSDPDLLPTLQHLMMDLVETDPIFLRFVFKYWQFNLASDAEQQDTTLAELYT